MNKSNQFKASLLFGIFMTVFFSFRFLFLEENSSSGEIFRHLVFVILSGSLSGVLFGWLIGLFSRSKFVKETTKIETEQGESILFQTTANHFKGFEAVGGKLYLTNRRLVFKSYKLNLQNHLFSLPLNKITRIERYKSLGLINNGLAIYSEDNNTEKFVVEQVSEWIKLILI